MFITGLLLGTLLGFFMAALVMAAGDRMHEEEDLQKWAEEQAAKRGKKDEGKEKG